MSRRRREYTPQHSTQTAAQPSLGASHVSLLGADDLHLFNQGTHGRLYDKLGAHVLTDPATSGTHFAVWAPEAVQVCVIGDFNDWQNDSHVLQPCGQSGLWAWFVPGLGDGARYKYRIVSRHGGYCVDKADPFGFYHETPPMTASIVHSLWYDWSDQEWMAERARRNALEAPMAIYEVHLGSWRRVLEDHNRPLSYRELAPVLAEYVQRLGFTHVEFLPIMEHPFYGSWGYQVTGYFAPTSRYGTPQDFMFLDPRQGVHADWDTFVFNYGRHEVQSFLISNALFWLDVYHADGLRVDAVASMLYLDYSRREGEWVPNAYGGRENLDAIALLRRCNAAVFGQYSDVQTMAEESTAWPMVSRPLYVGGLGFGLKWDMGWMHDILDYMQQDPIHRKYHHNLLTFRQLYASSENFVLPLSHDEVVYGKASLLGKMPGDDGQKFANLRLLLGYMYGQNGKKLLFMGGEFGQWQEWHHDASLEWHLLASAPHAGVQQWVADLNRFYRQPPALYERDCAPDGLAWVDCNDAEHSVVSFLRRGQSAQDLVLIVCNFTPVLRHNYRIGVPHGGLWHEALNSDAREYAGSGHGNQGEVEAAPIPCHGRPYSLVLTLPPLAVVFLVSPVA